MKYISFWEYCPEDLDKILERSKQFSEDIEKHPEKYPTILFPSHIMGGESKGFAVYEATSEQLTRFVLQWRPLMTVKFVPIFKSEKFIIQYLETKK